MRILLYSDTEQSNVVSFLDDLQRRVSQQGDSAKEIYTPRSDNDEALEPAKPGEGARMDHHNILSSLTEAQLTLMAVTGHKGVLRPS